ncbi:MAG: hypothetical protein ACXVEF_13040 [Polyangiales bacterium]
MIHRIAFVALLALGAIGCEAKIDSSDLDATPIDDAPSWETDSSATDDAVDSSASDVVVDSGVDGAPADAIGDGASDSDALVTWTLGDAAAVSPAFVATTTPCGPKPGADSSVVLDQALWSSVGWVGRHANRAFVASARKWVIFDADTGEQTASGEVDSPTTFAYGGTTFAMQTASGLELHDATSGAVHATIPSTADRYGFANDGSYVWTIEPAKIQFWSPTTGASIASRAGSFAPMISSSSVLDFAVDARPTEIRIARDGLYDRVDPKTGTIIDSLSYAGDALWFSGDGSTLTVTTPGHVTLLSATTLTAATDVPYYSAAYGTMLVTTSGVIDHVTKATILTWPVMSGELLRQGSRVLITRRGGARWVDLSTSPPTTGDMALEGATRLTSLAIDTDGTWVVGDDSGLAWTGKTTPRTLGCGRSTAVAAADDGSMAVATAKGVVIGSVGATTSTISGYIPLSSDCLELSRDGKTLAILDDHGGADGIARVHLYSLATKKAGIVLERPVDIDGSREQAWWNVSLDAAGARLAISAWNNTPSPSHEGTHAVLDAATGALVRRWELSAAPFYGFGAYLSPDGQHLARAIPTGKFSYATLRLADIASGTEIASVRDPFGWVGDEILAHDDYKYTYFVDVMGVETFGPPLYYSLWSKFGSCRPPAKQISPTRIFVDEMYDTLSVDPHPVTALGPPNAATSARIVHLGPGKVTSMAFPP